LRSRVKLDIKTLDEFKPFFKDIDKNKLSVSNDEIIEHLNDNQVTNVNPITEIKDWSLYDVSIL
jgi:hypothetical protein